MAKKILIVEDEPNFHEIYKEMFEGKGYDIVSAYDGDEALEKVKQEKPDLIITDMLLNMVTGDTFILWLKAMPEYADVPVIIVSAYSQKDYKNLEHIGPNLVYLEKLNLTEKILLKEVERELRSSQTRKGFIIREKENCSKR